MLTTYTIYKFVDKTIHTPIHIWKQMKIMEVTKVSHFNFLLEVSFYLNMSKLLINIYIQDTTPSIINMEIQGRPLRRLERKNS